MVSDNAPIANTPRKLNITINNKQKVNIFFLKAMPINKNLAMQHHNLLMYAE
ncbi:MAG: hypothetical protein R2807_05385 [Chitinophagales bacterium]